MVILSPKKISLSQRLPYPRYPRVWNEYFFSSQQMGYFCNQGIPNIKEKMFSSFLRQKKSQRLPYPILSTSVEIGKGKRWKSKKWFSVNFIKTYKKINKSFKNHQKIEKKNLIACPSPYIGQAMKLERASAEKLKNHFSLSFFVLRKKQLKNHLKPPKNQL